ncbi:MAG TPA: molybdopterin-guanine dinucleotide biosynthesis protein B [Methanomicrobiales archaeon]|nr:molybdopterin-guanine dinucleotide biosynthesis protein B [Methanomicrobiales archaeon]
MKIIQVVGTSGIGKTTFIENLIPSLTALGRTAAVKHLGGHQYALEEGKDTTRFFQREASFAVGIDAEKAVLVAADGELDATLRMLSDAGVEYAIIEGFKSRPYPKIVIGDLTIEHVVLRNPSVEEVMRSLDAFCDYLSAQGLVWDLRREHGMDRKAKFFTYCGTVPGASGRAPAGCSEDRQGDLARIQADLASTPGVIGVRLHAASGKVYAGEATIYMAVMAEDGSAGVLAMEKALNTLERGR